MKKAMKKIAKIVLWFFCIIIGFISLAMLIGCILQNTYYKTELKAVKPYGQLVEVNSKNMHVYSMGNGKETIVLLAGHGVPLPSADFGPLMRELSKKYTVVTVEYFGVGFSDETDKPRTCENYMNEIRTSLKQAGIEPPYILMPHSISGIYSEYYASKYPQEVSGLILLDSTSTAFTMKLPDNVISSYQVVKFQQNISLNRLVNSFVSEDMLVQAGFAITKDNGYTQKETDDYKKYMQYSLNNTIIEQFKSTMDCIREAQDVPFPKDMPVLKIISKDTVEVKDKLNGIDGDIGGMDYQQSHLERLGNNTSHVILDGTHFIYHNQVNKIATLTDKFIADLK